MIKLKPRNRIISLRYWGLRVNRYGPEVIKPSLRPEVFLLPRVATPHDTSRVPTKPTGIPSTNLTSALNFHVFQSRRIKAAFIMKTAEKHIPVNTYCQDRLPGDGQSRVSCITTDQITPVNIINKIITSNVNSKSTILFTGISLIEIAQLAMLSSLLYPGQPPDNHDCPQKSSPDCKTYQQQRHQFQSSS